MLPRPTTTPVTATRTLDKRPPMVLSTAIVDRFCFQGYVVDRLRWEVRGPGGPIKLCRKSFDVLLYLIDNRDRVVGKEELLENLWPGQIVEESNLSQQVFLVRKALSSHESGAKIIDTVKGRGYRFAAEPDPELIPDETIAPPIRPELAQVQLQPASGFPLQPPNGFQQQPLNGFHPQQPNRSITFKAVRSQNLSAAATICALAVMGLFYWHPRGHEQADPASLISPGGRIQESLGRISERAELLPMSPLNRERMP